MTHRNRVGYRYIVYLAFANMLSMQAADINAPAVLGVTDKVVATGVAVLTLQTLFGIPDYTATDGGQSGKPRDLILQHVGSLLES